LVNAFTDLTLDGSLSMLYDAIAAAVAAGVVLGLAAIWLSVAARGGDAS
jgi:hypothetical protein